VTPEFDEFPGDIISLVFGESIVQYSLINGVDYTVPSSRSISIPDSTRVLMLRMRMLTSLSDDE
jgi:hypothetical protein